MRSITCRATEGKAGSFRSAVRFWVIEFAVDMGYILLIGWKAGGSSEDCARLRNFHRIAHICGGMHIKVVIEGG